MLTDIENIISNEELFMALANSSILVTGATGLIGSMLLKTIQAADEKYNLKIQLYGQIRDFNKAKIIFGESYDLYDFIYDINDYHFDFIIHTVSPTTSKFFIEHPVETIKVSVGTTIDVLDIALKNDSSIVYLSSMEQYGIPYETGQIMTEDKVGIIDHLNIRSSYSESKRLCECLCSSYASEYNLDVKIARLAQTFGAGSLLSDNRMPMQFARAVIDEKDIVLHTKGMSLSNFVYLSDAILGIIVVLVKGLKGEAYNICNDKETKSVKEIADLVCSEVAGGKIKVRIETKSDMGYAPDVAMYLDSQKLRNLGWEATVDMVEAYRRLVDYLQQ